MIGGGKESQLLTTHPSMFQEKQVTQCTNKIHYTTQGQTQCITLRAATIGPIEKVYKYLCVTSMR